MMQVTIAIIYEVIYALPIGIFTLTLVHAKCEGQDRTYLDSKRLLNGDKSMPVTT